MTVRITKNSRLQFAKLLLADDVEFWELLDLPTIPPQTDDIRYSVVDNDRIDLLASRFYGDPTFWWVIALANDIELVPTYLNPGSTLLLPSPRYVTQVLMKGLGAGRRR